MCPELHPNPVVCGAIARYRWLHFSRGDNQHMGVSIGLREDRFREADVRRIESIPKWAQGRLAAVRLRSKMFDFLMVNVYWPPEGSVPNLVARFAAFIGMLLEATPARTVPLVVGDCNSCLGGWRILTAVRLLTSAPRWAPTRRAVARIRTAPSSAGSPRRTALPWWTPTLPSQRLSMRTPEDASRTHSWPKSLVWRPCCASAMHCSSSHVRPAAITGHCRLASRTGFGTTTLSLRKRRGPGPTPMGEALARVAPRKLLGQGRLGLGGGVR